MASAPLPPQPQHHQQQQQQQQQSMCNEVVVTSGAASTTSTSTVAMPSGPCGAVEAVFVDADAVTSPPRTVDHADSGITLQSAGFTQLHMPVLPDESPTAPPCRRPSMDRHGLKFGPG